MLHFIEHLDTLERYPNLGERLARFSRHVVCVHLDIADELNGLLGRE
jgi:hypothetical protein